MMKIISLENACDGKKPIETSAVFIPFSGSKSSVSMPVLESDPILGIEVSDDEILKGLLATDDFFQLLLGNAECCFISD